MDRSILHEFRRATEGPDSAVDLFEAVMLVASLDSGPAESGPVARWLGQVADDARDYAGSAPTVEALAGAIDYQLFTVHRFVGDAAAFRDPASCLLPSVVTRRKGIPISLSIVYMEVARRAGLRCDGVGYPGHFLVRCGTPEEPLYVDPFNGGVRLDRDELLAGLRGLHAGSATPESYLAGVTRRQVLQRLLGNLHSIYRERRDVARWLGTVEFRLCLEPWNAALVGERGMLHYRSGHQALALDDLERYAAAMRPQAVSAGALRLLDELRLRLGGSRGSE